MSALSSPILVLGATSLIGDFLIERLAAGGHDYYGLSREAPVDDVRMIRGDLSEDDLAQRLPPTATVFSLSPIWLLPKALPALKAAGMKRLVAFSSTSRFTKAASANAEEREVAQALADAEAATIAFCQANKVAWTILRPTLIYAEGRDRNVSRLAGLIRRLGFLPLSGQGGGLRQPVHAADLAQGAIDAAASAKAKNRAYDLTGGETLSYRAMAGRVFEGLGRRPLIVSLPPALWRIGLTLASPIMPGVTAGMGERMEADLTFESGDAARDFGWAPRDFHPRF
ncbi:NAD-dependent epimerase/dehydratase family protein [Caulobacter sp. NIBR2454]|uniref:NAD-dependent epimerase/dehydratase family protein n=1 Tax=Caulobacter sp. NIBR2454 TaxID=3015996 RepID=UPI0022B5F1BD|nr:NAD-dependent epimerase/dehydratase family protein [Caulobacter sp. NIBR2454]